MVSDSNRNNFRPLGEFLRSMGVQDPEAFVAEPLPELNPKHEPSRTPLGEDELLPCGCPAWTVYGGWQEPHDCCICKDAGTVIVSRDRQSPDFGRSVPCSCRLPAGAEAMGAAPLPQLLLGFMDDAHVPGLYRHANLWQLDYGPDQPALVVARSYVSAWPPDPPFLVIRSGTVGNGKSTLACATLLAAFERHRVRSRFWRVVELIDLMRASYDAGGNQSLAEIDRELRAAPLLVLDDLGAERETDYARERLYSIVDDRYGRLAPTIVTTNVGSSGLDPRTASRLTDTQVCRAVTLRGPDRRPARSKP